MSQITSGLRYVLGNPLIYSLFQNFVGAGRFRKSFVVNHLRIQSGNQVLEIGCGPGDFLEYIPEEIKYTGFDLSQAYIDSARQRYGHRQNCQFHCADVRDFALADPVRFDVCFAAGVLHHLSDVEGAKLFKTAQGALKPGGRFVSVDPVFVDGQSGIAKFVISKDRGQNVRSPLAYQELARNIFDNVKASIHHDLLRIPYSHIIMECTR